MTMELKDKKGQPVTDWRDWPLPKADHQWRSARSAMELARAWFTSPSPCVPVELSVLLDTNPLTRGMAVTRGIPECVTPLPGRGEGRNHDLVLVGRTDAGQVTICVEAKADETFGEVVGRYLAHTKKKAAAEGRRTNLPARASALVQLLFGPDASPEVEPWRSLRYQLLTGAAGALLQADLDGSDIAVFVVHEFLTEAVDRDKKVQVNARDLEKLVEALLGESHGSRSVGNLAGPLRFSAGKFLRRPLSLLLGKVTYDWRRTRPRDSRG